MFVAGADSPLGRSPIRFHLSSPYRDALGIRIDGTSLAAGLFPRGGGGASVNSHRGYLVGEARKALCYRPCPGNVFPFTGTIVPVNGNTGAVWAVVWERIGGTLKSPPGPYPILKGFFSFSSFWGEKRGWEFVGDVMGERSGWEFWGDVMGERRGWEFKG